MHQEERVSTDLQGCQGNLFYGDVELVTFCVVESLLEGVQEKIGNGCASVLNTHLSRGIKSSSKNMRYKYFSLSRNQQKECRRKLSRNLRLSQKETTNITRSF